MVFLVAALLLQQGVWRPTINNVSRFPSALKVSGRAAALARLDEILPILKAAIPTDNVQLQAQRSFADDPELAGMPWPRNLSVYGYEVGMRGGWEGEAAFTVDVFVDDMNLLMGILLDEPRMYRLGTPPGMLVLLRPGGGVPWKPVSQREYTRRMRVYFAARASRDRTSRDALAQLDRDAPSASDAPMFVPKRSRSAWPGYSGGEDAVVDVDPSYFAGRPQDAIEVMVLKGAVNHPSEHPAAARRLRAFWQKLDRDALRRLLQ